jgi:hypothetical protein
VNARHRPRRKRLQDGDGRGVRREGRLNAETEQCYHGGKSRIAPDELEEDPRRDKWCATLAIAMGRSINVVFARLALKHLTPEDLTAVGGALGFGAPVPFAVPNQAPEIKLPQDPLEFARSAAGFWHTTPRRSRPLRSRNDRERRVAPNRASSTP